VGDGGEREEQGVVQREELPSWARDALRAYEDSRLRDARYHEHLGGLWRFPDGKLSFWGKHGPLERPLSCNLALSWFVGLGIWSWAIFGLGDGEIDLWRFVLGGGLLVLGTVAFTHHQDAHTLPRRDGLLVVPDGFVLIDGDSYRPLARDDISELEIRGRELWAIARDGAPMLVQTTKGYREDHELSSTILAHRAALLDDWRTQGVVAEPPSDDAHSEHKSRSSSILMLTGVAAVTSGLVYVSGVMPKRSDAAEAVKSFVADLHAGDVDAAYERLTPRRQRERPRSEFRESLPPSFLEASDYDVEAWAQASGGGARRTCVHGVLEGVAVDDSFYAFVLVSVDGQPKIDTWRSETCKLSWWR
jgi:hypothetical protein